MRLVGRIDANWRRNGVTAKLASGSLWSIHSVAVEDIDVQQAEPHLAHIFGRHHGRLTDIATDPELLASGPYSGWSAGTPVDFPVFLAVRSDDRHRVFDGIHRAIQLVLNGDRELRLCEPD